ncbi:MAG: hypothetical protein ACRD0W_17240 [Acidimicrobiales bacterium]
MDATNAVRWLIAALAALGIVALLAYVRNDPGVGGRFPDPEDVHRVVIVADVAHDET